jgi:hypothetical protein
MAVPFVIPLQVEELLTPATNRYSIQRSYAVDSSSDSVLQKALEGDCWLLLLILIEIIGRVKKAGALQMIKHENFDTFFFFVQ